MNKKTKDIEEKREGVVFLKSNFREVLLCILVIFLFFLLSIRFSPYQLISSDIYQFMSSVNQISKEDIQSIGDPFFNQLSSDPHYGFYLSSLAILKVLTQMNVREIFVLLNFFNFILLIFSIYYFALYFTQNKQKAAVIASVSLFLWGASKPFWAGFLSISDLVFTSSFPATIGLVFMLFVVVWIDKYLSCGNNQVLVLVFLLEFFIFLSHQFTMVILIILILGILLSRLNSFKSNKLRFILILIMPFFVLIFSLIWPVFNSLSLFSNLTFFNFSSFNLIGTFSFKFSDWVILAGPFFALGVFGFFKIPKNIRVFFFVSILITFIVSISYLFSFRPSLLWRFWPVMVFLANFLFIYFVLSEKSKYYQIFLIFLMILLGFVFFSQNMINNTKYDSNYLDIYQNLPPIEQNLTILTDPITSYHLSAFFNYRVFAVPLNHINPFNEQESYKRYNFVYDFFVLRNISVENITQEYPLENFVLVLNKNYKGDSLMFFNGNISIYSIDQETKHYVSQENDYFIVKILN